jgi:hypothetical protein
MVVEVKKPEILFNEGLALEQKEEQKQQQTTKAEIEHKEQEEKPIVENQSNSSEEYHGGTESTESIKDSNNQSRQEQQNQQSQEADQQQEANNQQVDIDNQQNEQQDNNNQQQGQKENNSQESENQNSESGNQDYSNENYGDEDQESEEYNDGEEYGEDEDYSDEESQDYNNDEDGDYDGESDNYEDEDEEYDGDEGEDNEDEYYEESEEEDQDQSNSYYYNTQQAFSIENNSIASRKLYLEFYKLIEYLSDEEKTLSNLPGSSMALNIKKLMFRQYEKKSLSYYYQYKNRSGVIIILDNSGSMTWLMKELNTVFNAAAKRRDAIIYIAPNGGIEAKYDSKTKRFEPINHYEAVEEIVKSGLPTIYIGDYDGADFPIELSHYTRVYWICTETRYYFFRSHGWISYNEEDFRGFFGRAFNEEEIIRVLQEFSRNITRQQYWYDEHEPEEFEDYQED